jgi:hypothetical protein
MTMSESAMVGRGECTNSSAGAGAGAGAGASDAVTQ